MMIHIYNPTALKSRANDASLFAAATTNTTTATPAEGHAGTHPVAVASVLQDNSLLVGSFSGDKAGRPSGCCLLGLGAVGIAAQKDGLVSFLLRQPGVFVSLQGFVVELRGPRDGVPLIPQRDGFHFVKAGVALQCGIHVELVSKPRPEHLGARWNGYWERVERQQDRTRWHTRQQTRNEMIEKQEFILIAGGGGFLGKDAIEIVAKGLDGSAVRSRIGQKRAVLQIFQSSLPKFYPADLVFLVVAIAVQVLANGAQLELNGDRRCVPIPDEFNAASIALSLVGGLRGRVADAVTNVQEQIAISIQLKDLKDNISRKKFDAAVLGFGL